ncbi:MAG: hypothetical protein CMO16_04270 [Thaumarchaeota archaeon]|nr:hypothetical protein [Nitrososphaerota archaeon]
MQHVPIVIAISVILVTSLGLNSVVGVSTIKTSLNLNDLSDFPITQGEEMIFSGRLTKATTSAGIVDANIVIVHNISFNNNKILVQGLTDANGYYSIPWVIDVEKIEPKTGGSFGTDSTQGREKRFQVNVFAQFNDNDQFQHSVSGSQSFEVRLNQLKISVEKKVQYLAFESSIIRIRITDNNNSLLDPDILSSFYDNIPITLVHDGLGMYSFTISSLTAGLHSFKVIAEKSGHVTDDQLVTIEVLKRKTALVIHSKSTYEQGETIVISVNLLDKNINSLIPDKPIIVSLKAPNHVVNPLTSVNGKITYVLTKFDAIGKWSISVNFAGDSAYSSSSKSISFVVEREKSVVKPSLPIEKISVEEIGLVDQQGSMMHNISVGQQVVIQSKVNSNFDADEEITYISQVKNIDDITVSLSWITTTISPEQSLEIAISWLPYKPGEYRVEVFVWDDIQTPEPLSFEVKRSTIVVN